MLKRQGKNYLRRVERRSHDDFSRGFFMGLLKLVAKTAQQVLTASFVPKLAYSLQLLISLRSCVFK